MTTKAAPNSPPSYIHDNRDTVNIFSRGVLSYATPMLLHGYTKLVDSNQPLELEDCILPAKDEIPAFWHDKFEKLLQEEMQRTSGAPETFSLAKVLYRCFREDFWWSGLCRFFSDVCLFVTPILLQRIILFLKSSDDPSWLGFVWAILLCLSGGLFGFLANTHFGICFQAGGNARNVLMTAVYRRILKMPTITDSGTLLSLHSNDCMKFYDAAPQLHTVWSAPIIIIVFIIQLWFYVGWASVIGFGVMVVCSILQGGFAATVFSSYEEVANKSSERVQKVNEVLQGIRICKFMCWEKCFLNRVEKSRRQEMKLNEQFSNKKAAVFSFMLMIPSFIVYVVFSVSVWLQGSFESANVFPAMAVLNGIKMPIMMLPMAVARLFDIGVSLNRISKFFLSVAELEGKVDKTIRCEKNGETAIVMNNASLGYMTTEKDKPKDNEEKTDKNKDKDKENDKGITIRKEILNNVQIRIPTGSFTFVVGKTGSGKSTLMNAFLGEEGIDISPPRSVTIYGKVSFCAQQAWIMNATLKNNILFGNPFDQDRYDAVVKVCQLLSDFKQLPNADDTEIGEKGINLSGGQKQRVALARAVYAEADTYVFDDPLSAVDSHVSQALMTECFLNFLAKKTRILVTHQTQYVHHADAVYAITDGTLTQKDPADFNSPQKGNNKEEGGDDEIGGEANDMIGATPQGSPAAVAPAEDVGGVVPDAEAGVLIHKEVTEVGNVRFSVFKFYFRACSYVVCFLVLLANVLYQAARQMGDVWLAWWPERYLNITNNDYLMWWGITSIGCFILTYGRENIVMTAQFVSSRKLHTQVITQHLHAPTWYYDVTPIGRMMTIFTRDFDCVDKHLAESYSWFFILLVDVLGSSILISVATPYTSIAIVLCALLYRQIHKFYSATYRGIKRLEGVYRAPVLSLMSESISGLSTIRASGYTQWVIDQHELRLCDLSRVMVNMTQSIGWLRIRLEFIGTCVVLVCSMTAIAQKVTSDSVNVSVLGLAIVYGLNVTQFLGNVTLLFTEIESSMNCVERIKAAIEDIPQEKTVVYSSNPDGHPEPSKMWPEKGSIEFKNLSLRYRPGLPLVLKGVNCNIPSKARVGIVGRTGSGKSTFLLALLRIVEASEGSIFIDGRDTSTLQMQDLRNRITVIPQEPILFEGTLRSNLDPFHEYSDEKLRTVLKKVHLSERFPSLKEPIVERGTNISVGQRQLVCIARALLRECKILLMDEATASVDNATDLLIQRTVRTEFQNCTVLTIAHRLMTVMDSDLIFVMDKGVLVQAGKPSALLGEAGGHFCAMIEQYGKEHAQVLMEVANGVISIEQVVEKGLLSATQTEENISSS